MKKLVIIGIMILILVNLICSCIRTAPVETPLSVADLGYNSYGHDISINDITSKSNVTIDVKESFVGVEKSLVYKDNIFELLYYRTLTYLLGEITVDQYSIKDSDNGSVLLLPDGTVYAILDFPVERVDISKYDDSDTVREVLETTFADIIDFSSFQYVTASETVSDKTNGFGLYRFVWYNMIGNVVSDKTVSMAVNQDGEVSALWLKNVNAPPYNDNIDSEQYILDIERKLTDIYGDALVEYEINSTELTVFDGSQSIVYLVGVRFDEDGQTRSEVRRFILKLDT